MIPVSVERDTTHLQATALIARRAIGAANTISKPSINKESCLAERLTTARSVRGIGKRPPARAACTKDEASGRGLMMAACCMDYFKLCKEMTLTT